MQTNDELIINLNMSNHWSWIVKSKKEENGYYMPCICLTRFDEILFNGSDVING
jgi:hypothetical protein